MGKYGAWDSKSQLMFIASMTDEDHERVVAALSRDRDERLARLDASLSRMAAEHAAGMVGGTAIGMGRAT